MKTTLEISEVLLKEAKKYAVQKGISFKAVVETALRKMLDKSQRPLTFNLRKATFRGSGVHEGIQEGDWVSIREKIYKGRGE